MLQVGDKMPSFAVADETGKMVTNKDLIGKKTVIAIGTGYKYTDDIPLAVLASLKHATSVTTTMLSWRKVTRSMA